MKPIARLGDLVVGGVHCHGGHTHPPPATPGRIREGSQKVFVCGRPAAREGDEGYSPLCCAGVGKIVVLGSQQRVFIEGRPAASLGTPTQHCDMAPGSIQTGCSKVLIP